MKNNNSSPIKLVALDMDGTAYYEEGDIVPQNLPPIRELLRQGIKVVFVTGRPLFCRQNRFLENRLITPTSLIVAYNGAVIYHFHSQQLLHSATISNEQMHLIYRLARILGNSETIVWGYVDNFKVAVLNRENPAERKETNLYDGEMDFFDGEYQTYSSHTPYSLFKVLIFGGTPLLFNRLRELGFSVATSDNWLAEVNAPGVNKGSALAWIGQYYGIDSQGMMAIGDGANDIPMMHAVKHSVSLSNSIEPLKAIAKYRIPLTNEQGGVGYAINHLILGKEWPE